MLKMRMIPQKIMASAVSDFRLTKGPINFLSIVKSISGINGRGIRKLRITWLYTRRASGLKPSMIITVAGTTLITRITILLIHGLTWVPIRPSRIACPASTPQQEDDKPEAIRVIANTVPARNPKSFLCIQLSIFLGTRQFNFDLI